MSYDYKKYYQKNKTEILKRRREHYKQNKEAELLRQKEYYEKNKEWINLRHREWVKKTKYIQFFHASKRIDRIDEEIKKRLEIKSFKNSSIIQQLKEERERQFLKMIPYLLRENVIKKMNNNQQQ
jgi:hypothetical protein